MYVELFYSLWRFVSENKLYIIEAVKYIFTDTIYVEDGYVFYRIEIEAFLSQN